MSFTSINELYEQLVSMKWPVVILNNPEEVEHSLISIGRFARICKDPSAMDELTDKQYENIGKHCISSGHFSPSRHLMWCFTVLDMSRVASHQMVRHHVGTAINQQSGVFTEITFKTNPLILPPRVRTALINDPEVAHEIAEGLALVESGIQRLKENNPNLNNSDLRYLMPSACSTAMNIALSPEALVHICHERMCSKAQVEIRHIVHQMAKLVEQVAPWWGDYLVPKCVHMNGCNEKLGCGYYNKIQATKFGEVNVEPLEVRIKGVTCKKCGTVLLHKDDDPSPLTDGLCRKCAREKAKE